LTWNKYSTKQLNEGNAMNHGHLDLTLAALADPTRRAILQRLTRGEARVTEIAQPLPMSLNAVSKHIRVLEGARLVQRRRAGREHWLRLNPEPLDEAAAWLDEQRALWTSRLNALGSLLDNEDRTGDRPANTRGDSP
jgi:DNA-binding transcriptional ArsR family regulator